VLTIQELEITLRGNMYFVINSSHSLKILAIISVIVQIQI